MLTRVNTPSRSIGKQLVSSAVVGPDLQLVHHKLVEHGRLVSPFGGVGPIPEAEPSNKMVFNDPSNVIAGPVARRPEGAETPRRVEVPFAASGPPILDIHSAAGGVERLCRPVCVSERSSCHRVSNVFGEDDVAMLHDRLPPAYGASALAFVLNAVSIKQRPPR